MQMPYLPRQVRQRAPVDDSTLSPRAAGLEPRSTRPVRKRQKTWGRRAVRAVA